MSVILQDFDMPRGCGCCPFNAYEYGCPYCCIEKSSTYDYIAGEYRGQRPDWCRLREQNER